MQWRTVDADGKEIRFAPPSTYEVGDGDAVRAMALAGCGIDLRKRDLCGVATDKTFTAETQAGD